jgi:hypothetical protein
MFNRTKQTLLYEMRKVVSKRTSNRPPNHWSAIAKYIFVFVCLRSCHSRDLIASCQAHLKFLWKKQITLSLSLLRFPVPLLYLSLLLILFSSNFNEFYYFFNGHTIHIYQVWDINCGIKAKVFFYLKIDDWAGAIAQL